jgi:hypothetical protein
MVIEKARLAVLASEDASRAWIVKLKVPWVVGVPEITPVEESNERPLGRGPEIRDQV